MKLDAIRGEVESFIREMDKEYYLNWAGLKDEMDTSSVFRSHARLFDPRVLDSVRSMKAGAAREDKRKLRFLEATLASGCMEQRVKELTDERNTLESKLAVKVEGKAIPFRMAAVRIANEDDRRKRGALFDARNAVLESRINGVLEKRIRRSHSIAKKLGYRNYAHMFSKTKNIDFDALMGDLGNLLNATEKVYREKMGALTENIGLSLEDAEKHDIGRLMRAKDFDRHFKKSKALPTLRSTLRGLGIDLDKQDNVKVDAAEREKKSPRAFCAPLEVPHEVMLVVMPMGGCSDYDALLHEAGHAEHYAHVSEDEEMEYKYLGDSSVTESYAFLLQYLTNDENWVKGNTKMDARTISSYLDFAHTQKLFFVRRYAAKLRYELALHKRGSKGMGNVYKRTMESVLRFRHPASHYLSDLDDGLYAAQYLRAWLLEAQLRREMRERFDEEWFADRKAGDYVRGLWACGQKYDAAEMSERMGYQLRTKELVEDLREGPGGG